MKKILQSVLILAGYIFASCTSAPRVVADLTESLPARAADSVMVFETDETVPQQARKIGTVKVTDGGLTPTSKCLFANMLSLAVKKTAESGANGFQIDKHKYPGTGGSTCHRIYGSMFAIPDSLVEYNVLTQIQKAEMNQDIELADMARRQMARAERMMDTPHNIVKVSGGPSWIDSKFQVGNRIYTSKAGFEYAIQYQHVWKCLGFGINYLHYNTSFDEGFDVSLLYIGPSFVFKSRIGEKWLMDASLGGGYSKYTERYGGLSGSESKFGGMLEFGFEYMLSKHIGLGVQSHLLTMKLPKPDGIELEKDEFYGIQRINLLGGLRFYF